MNAIRAVLALFGVFGIRGFSCGFGVHALKLYNGWVDRTFAVRILRYQVWGVHHIRSRRVVDAGIPPIRFRLLFPSLEYLSEELHLSLSFSVRFCGFQQTAVAACHQAMKVVECLIPATSHWFLLGNFQAAEVVPALSMLTVNWSHSVGIGLQRRTNLLTLTRPGFWILTNFNGTPWSVLDRFQAQDMAIQLTFSDRVCLWLGVRVLTVSYTMTFTS